MDPNRNLTEMPYGNQSGNRNSDNMPYGNQGRNQNPGNMPYNNWNPDWNTMDYRGGIYYPDYGSEMENQSDMRYMKELYPELAKRIQALAEEECDRMDYDGSMIYDEYPDRVMIYRIVNRILERLIAEGAISPIESDMGNEQDVNSEMEPISAMQDRRECRGRNCRNPRFEDFIQVILLNEIFKRRSNRRNRRRRYW